MAQTHSLDLEASSSQYAYITDASQSGLDITGDFTFEAWVKLESMPAGYNQVVVSKWNNSDTNDQSYLFDINTSGDLRIVWEDSSGNTNIVSNNNANIPLDTWVHIAVSVDVSQGVSGVKFYINGSLLSSNTTDNNGGATSIRNSNAEFQIGNHHNDTNYFDGLIKDVRVFNDIRTQEEIASDAYTEQVSDANLQAEWNFNNDYTDNTANGNDLTASGSPVFSIDIPWHSTNRRAGFCAFF